MAALITHAGTDRRQTATTTAAERLRRAAEFRTPCTPVRDIIGTSDTALAYAVQQHNTAERTAAGGRVVGRKVGLTSVAVQRQLGVDRPDFGVLFDDMDVSALDRAPFDRLLQPRIEAEVAFVLGEDLLQGPFDARTVASAVGYAVAALEVVDSRIADWDVTFADTVADNASSGLFVLSAEQRTLDEFEPATATMRMSVDGALVSEGTGAACLGDPLNALAWLAHTAVTFGEPLREGQVVLSGALGPMVAVTPGSRVRAEISGLGSVHVEFDTTAAHA